MTGDGLWNGLIALLNALGGGAGVAALITALIALVKSVSAGKEAKAATRAVQRLEANASSNASANQSVVNNTWHAQNLYVNVPVEEVTKPEATSAGFAPATESLDWKPGEVIEAPKAAEVPPESGPKTPSD